MNNCKVSNWLSSINTSRNEKIEQEQDKVSNKLLNTLTVEIEKAHHRNIRKIQGDGKYN